MKTRCADESHGYGQFLLSHKGNLTLALSGVAYVASWLVMRLTPWKLTGDVAVSIAEAALIGGLCDYLALKMIFEQRWYLPNSGVLPRNRAKLIEGIASTIENEWLTPQMIGQRLNEMNLVGRLGSYLEDIRLEALIGEQGLDPLLERVLHYLASPDSRERLETILGKALPKTFARLYAGARRLGLESLSTRLVANLLQRLPELRRDLELAETVESAIHEFGHQLRDPSSYAYQLARRLIDGIVRRAVDASRGQISHMVRENLALLSDEQIKIQIESKTRAHLDWIRVNGGIFGAFFGLLFALSRIIMHHGTVFVARLHALG
ncbi:MAG TPA: DUF445 family protein [Candidatus Binataceae bacterium]|nr:DUF445 family protein [Candidatus Binataceae bacterium]